MKKFKVESFGKEYIVYPHIDKYTNNDTLAIVLMLQNNYEKFCNLTVNLPQYTQVLKSFGFEYQFVDTNGFPNAIKFIVDNKLGELTHMRGYSGYCEYPVVKFNLKEFI